LDDIVPDVVPVEDRTVKDWEHAPYSGYYDGAQTLNPREAVRLIHFNISLMITGTWIWGRGSCDDKSDLIRQLLAVDSLLKQGFSPARTLVLAYGFDEESKGIEVRSTSTWKSNR
jgi:Gly-Xaa carboxypeptidase